jgi:predicted RNase H-like HicB family nuclease
MKRYEVVFEQGAKNWAAHVPDLLGCVTTGANLDEVERNIQEAIEGHVRTLIEFGEAIPEPRSSAR